MRDLLLVPAALLGLAVAAAAQVPSPPSSDPSAQRIEERIRSLQREAERLAGQARTLLTELRALEIERDLRVAEARRASVAAEEVQRALQETTDRLARLEADRQSQLPDVKAHLVDLYKRGRTGYVHLLFGASDLRELARATRAVSALVAINQRRLDEHRRTLDGLRSERAALAERTAQLETHRAEAAGAQTAAERAVRAHAQLVARIDAQRDLNAQYVGELQAAYDRLQQQLPADARRDAAVPLAPFRGALEWPVAGRVLARYGQSAGRLGGSAVRNGIEIAAAEGAPVRAVHGGVVAYADAYTGFGTLVILDHGGNNYSLYGYLGSAAVDSGATVEAGTELGRVGFSPAGPAALYFEIRIDGRSVDPVQWLKSR